MQRTCGILNVGDGAWAFEEHAQRLSLLLGVEITETPCDFNYVLSMEDDTLPPSRQSFIPLESLRLASDKRLLATAFQQGGVATPITYLAESADAAWAIVQSHPQNEWCLKWPIGCGAAGHRLIESPASIPPDWPLPYVVQEFIRMPSPEVYRIYGCGGETFGWITRKFPAETTPSPWVSHARGGRYFSEGAAPEEAQTQARLALTATGLFDSFGCVDLLRASDRRWLVLEVGTDGIYNHVDRDIDNEALSAELDTRLARCFHARFL